MDLELCREARDFGAAALQAFGDAGGDGLLHAAEREPSRRAGLLEPLLMTLGAADLQPRASQDELEAAAALCRSAGWWALPYPVAEWLARPPDLGVNGLFVIAEGRIAGAVAGLDWRCALTDLAGRRYTATPVPPSEPARVTQFVTELRPTAASDGPASDAALQMTLRCWVLLGMLDRAMALTREHVLSRDQFGQPLARFQGVQFQLTEAEVERAGVEELAMYALWSVGAGRPDAIADALALRLAALEAADLVLRTSHQLHGAMGFCDESPLSWISRYSQPIRQLPWGVSGTLDQLSRMAGTRGLAGIFRPGPLV